MSYRTHQRALPGGGSPAPYITSAVHTSHSFGPDDYDKDYKSAVEVQYVEVPYPRRVSVPRRRAAPDYKPFPLRWQFLAVTVALIAAVIGAVASACVVLPAEVDRGFVPSARSIAVRSPPAQRARIQRRNDTEPAASPSVPTPTATLPPAVSLPVPIPAATSSPVSWPSNAPTAAREPNTALTTDEAGRILLPGGQEATQWVGGAVLSASGFYTVEIRGSMTTLTTTASFYSVYRPPDTNYASGTASVTYTDEWSEGNDITVALGPPLRSMPMTTKVPVSDPRPPSTRASSLYAGLVTTLTSTVSAPLTTTKVASDEYIAGLPGWVPTRVGETSMTVLLPGAPGVRTSVVTETNIIGSLTTITTVVVDGLPQYMRADVVTLSSARGTPATTVTRLIREIPPAYARPSVITVTNAEGVPITTVTSTPRPMSTPRTIIETDARGRPTLTYVTSISATPRVVTYTDSRGVPTETATEYPVNPTDEPPVSFDSVVKVYEVSQGAYFVGFFLPPIISGLLTIPIRMIDLSAKQFQPWHELTRVRGVTADQSLCLRTGGFHGLVSGVRSLAGGQALLFLTTLLTICSIILVPLSSEAIALKLHGSCTKTDFRGCAMSLGVFLGPAKAALALLVCMVVLILLILVALKRWKSGVTANPWTIGGIASLSMSREVRTLFCQLPKGIKGRIEHKKMIRALSGKTFKLGYFSDYPGVPEYGIVIHREVTPGLPKVGSKLSLYLKKSRESMRPNNGSEENSEEYHLPFLMLSFTWRIVFLLFLSGVLVVILYYNNTGGDTPFERFMATQGFGVRALFTLIGVGITFYWSSADSRPGYPQPIPSPFAGTSTGGAFFVALSAPACHHGHPERSSARKSVPRPRRHHLHNGRVYAHPAQQHTIPSYTDLYDAHGLHMDGSRHPMLHVACRRWQLLCELAPHARRSEHHRGRHVLRVRLKDTVEFRGAECIAQSTERFEGVRDGREVPFR
jgi:hypothetical protein